MKEKQDYGVLGFDPITFTAHTPLELTMRADPQRPFRPRWLFLDPADGLSVVSVTVGQNREIQQSATPLPGELFAMPGMVGALKMERNAERLIVTVDPERKLPPPLAMSVARPGCLVRVQLAIREKLRGSQTITVYAAMVGDDIDD